MLLNDSSSLFVFFFYSNDPTTHRHVFTASGNNNVKFILPQAYFDYNVYDEYVSMSRFSYRAQDFTVCRLPKPRETAFSLIQKENGIF